MLINWNLQYIYIQKNSKNLILFRNSFPEVHENRPLQPFFFHLFYTNYKPIIKLYIHIIIDNIFHQILNGLGHNQHIHIHLSGILYLRELYHHNNI